MAHTLSVTFFLILLNTFISTAQEASVKSDTSNSLFGIKAGINLSSLSASVNAESRSKFGPTFGIYLKKQVDKNLFIRYELYYSNQGQKVNYLFSYGGPSIGSTTINLHYLNLPILFEFGKKLSFQFGGQIGLLISGREKGMVSSVEVDEKLNDSMKTGDFSLVVGVAHSMGRHFNSGIRLNYGVSNILSDPEDVNYNIEIPKVMNRVLHFYVAYTF